MKGRVKYYNESKGFGFIIGEDNNDYFFHITNVESFELPEQRSMVQFTETANEKGLCAVDIIVLENKKTSSIIILDDVRVKLSNIKNYGITKNKYAYEKIYEVEEIKGGKITKFLYGETRLVWNGKIARISDKRYKNLKAVNNKEKYREPGCMPWRAEWDGICSTYKRYIDSDGKIKESDLYTNESHDDDLPYVMKEIECLYITTYQNDNFIFRQDESDFDIFEKCTEIDLAFSSK